MGGLIGIKKHPSNGTLARLSGIKDNFGPADLVSVPIVWVIANYYLQYLASILFGSVGVTLMSQLIMHWRKTAYYPYRFGFWLTNGMALWFIWVALDIFRLVPNYAGATILGFYVAFYLVIIYALSIRKRVNLKAI